MKLKNYALGEQIVRTDNRTRIKYLVFCLFVSFFLTTCYSFNIPEGDEKENGVNFVKLSFSRAALNNNDNDNDNDNDNNNNNNIDNDNDNDNDNNAKIFEKCFENWSGTASYVDSIEVLEINRDNSNRNSFKNSKISKYASYILFSKNEDTDIRTILRTFELENFKFYGDCIVSTIVKNTAISIAMDDKIVIGVLPASWKMQDRLMREVEKEERLESFMLIDNELEFMQAGGNNHHHQQQKKDKSVGRITEHTTFHTLNMKQQSKFRLSSSSSSSFFNTTETNPRSLFLTIGNEMEKEDIDELVIKWNTELISNEFATSETLISLSKKIRQGSKSKSKNRKRKRFITIDNIEQSEMKNVINYFSLQPEIEFIEKKPKFDLMNKWAKGLIQSGKWQEKPFFDIGLSGDDQIIGIADTGIDTKSCYFKDDNIPIPFNKVDDRHRKIVNYISYADNGDNGDVNDGNIGHGTHVSGAAVGKATGDKSNGYNGMAPNAKLAFFDVAKFGADGISLDLMVPNDLYDDVFEPLYNSGAKILSMSWGAADLNCYTSFSVMVDEFMWDNPESLILFAGGNTGEEGLGSVVTPATAKSCVTVGASFNMIQSTFSLADNLNHVAYFSSMGPTEDGRMKPDVLAPGYYVTSALNSDTCGVGVLKGTSMATPIMAGAAAIIRQFFTQGMYSPLQATVEVRRRRQRRRRSLLTNNNRRKFYDDFDDDVGDVDNNNKNTFEYDDDDDGITGSKNISTSYANKPLIPSGALLKAMLVHSGQKMKHYEGSNGDLYTMKFPGNVQGYGRIQLDDVINYDHQYSLLAIGSTDKNDDETYAAFHHTGDKDIIELQIADKDDIKALKITLVWTDYPGTPASCSGRGALSMMVNDLDIRVINHENGTEYYPITTDGTSYDRRNSLEQIIISNPIKNGNYTIEIIAHRIVSDHQPYALVVTGQFAGLEYNSTRTDDPSDDTLISYLYEMLTKNFEIVMTFSVLIVCFIWICVCHKIHHKRAKQQEHNNFNNSNNVNINVGEGPGYISQYE